MPIKVLIDRRKDSNTLLNRWKMSIACLMFRSVNRPKGEKWRALDLPDKWIIQRKENC